MFIARSCALARSLLSAGVRLSVRQSVTFAKFSHPLIFCTPLKEFILELGTGAGGQKIRVMGLPGRERSLSMTVTVKKTCLAHAVKEFLER